LREVRRIRREHLPGHGSGELREAFLQPVERAQALGIRAEVRGADHLLRRRQADAGEAVLPAGARVRNIFLQCLVDLTCIVCFVGNTFVKRNLTEVAARPLAFVFELDGSRRVFGTRSTPWILQQVHATILWIL
jgi:hypothetical protein